MVLLKITTKDYYIEQHVYSRKVDLISISEIDLKIATEIHEYIQSHPEPFRVIHSDENVILESIIITDPSYIQGIKYNFNFDTEYHNSDINLIKLIINHLKYIAYDKFMDTIYYNLPDADLAELLIHNLQHNRMRDDFKPFEHRLSNVVGLITLKHRISKYKNWEVSITKIIGTYLNSGYYKLYLINFHPELY
jgi:hypothetical protein